MDSLLLIIVGAALVALVLAIIFVIRCYKVAPVDKALIITGGRRPKIKVGGGAFVIPYIRRAAFFDLCMITIEASGDEIKTVTGVPIVVNWTAQIRPNSEETVKLLNAARSFFERGGDGIRKDIKLTLDGGVREVVAELTPEEVLIKKDAFSTKVKSSVAEEMDNMGFVLVSLNIQDVTDEGGYYNNMAAKDMEFRRREAANVTAEAEQAIQQKRAEADQAIRQKKAEADQQAQETELGAQLAVAERQRQNALRMAEMKIETDKAQADANIAGQLQSTTRQRELAVEEGQIEVRRQEQANLAAQKEAEVIATKAEAEKKRREIEVDADAKVIERQADAKAAAVKMEAQGQADAVKLKASGDADALKFQANAEAEAVKAKAAAEALGLKATAAAEAEQIALKGKAEADVRRQMGEAEAEAVRAKALAEAEGEKALADARAANNEVNFKIAKLEIETKARVEVATATATIMAEIGKNARFVNFGGGTVDGKGNVLFDTLGGVPALLEKLDITNQAVTDGTGFNETLKAAVAAVVEPLGVLAKQAPASGDALPEGTVKDQ